MRRFVRLALGATFACYASANAPAATPALQILYHEAIRPRTTLVSGHTRGMSFDAYGRRFNLTLQSNKSLLDAVPADRSDIEPLTGAVEGLPGSWVRLTRTRTGWHGMVSDGEELYAIEPAADVAGTTVQPLALSQSGQNVMYRLKDALLPLTPASCEILNPDGSVYSDSAAAASTRVTARSLVDRMAAEATTASAVPGLELTVGVVADYEFYQSFSDDPEGTIIARMDIADGIWSSQVGVKIHLAPLTVIKTADEPFTKTAPIDLLAQVRQYRSSHTDQQATGVTHLMTGRDLDGEIVGIAYLGSVCDSQTADSLSEGGHSTLMSGLIAAHELGHNFNSPHDGATGACSATPQTYLMAPKLNFSSQFSSCSLDQINARIRTASCVTAYQAPDVGIETPAQGTNSTTNSQASSSGGGGGLDMTALAILGSAAARRVLRRRRAT